MQRKVSGLLITVLASGALISSVPARAQDEAPPRLAIDPSAPATTSVPVEKPKQTLSEVLRWAYQNNPTIEAGRAALLAAQERLPQAMAGWKPSADATAGISRTWVDGSGTADGSTPKSVELSATQPVYRGGRTIAGTSSARNAILAQRAFLIATEQDVLLQTVTAYMDVIRDQNLYELSTNNKDVIAKQLDASKVRFEVGDATRTDVSQSEARSALSEANRVRALGNLRSSMAVYQQVTGAPVGTLVPPDIRLVMPDTLDAAIEMAETYNPSVLAADYLRHSAEDDINTVFGELLPELGIFGSYNHTIDPSPGLSDDQTVSAIGLSATIPLYRGGSTQSRVRQARSTAKQRMIEVHEAERLARQLTVSNWETLQASQAEILSRRAQVEASQIARDGVHKEAELGTRTILDALDADQELLDARSALVTAERNEVVARFALATTLGLMSPQALGFPELSRDYNEHLNDITGKIFSTRTSFGADIGAGSGKNPAKTPVNTGD